MSEREIFLNALERDDPVARAAYLEAACAGQPALRQRVEDLLRSHQQANTFLNVPVMEQLAAAEESLAYLQPTPEPSALGRLDHYEVLEIVGRGGAGVVLKARDTKLQRIVAIKVLARRLAGSCTARQRFVREAQAMAAVRDDNVIAIYAVSDDGPVPYLVMEFISGITLEERVRQAGALELKEMLRVGMQVAKGLAAAHAQGLIHRDIKPGNVLLENGVQRVKITDFGLATAAADAGPTDSRIFAGTPLYMSPEQARGEFTDHRTDLFSLGSVLYTLCTGHPPFLADSTAAVLKRVCEDTPEPIRAIQPNAPERLCEIIAKLHAKEKDQRYGSAREVAELLTEQLALLQQPPQTAPAPAAPAKSGRSESKLSDKRFSWWRGLAVAACLVLLPSIGVVIAWPKLGLEDKKRPIEPIELRREDIPPSLMALAGGGDPAKAPAELAGVLGDGRYLLPRIGQTAWLEQSPDGKLLAVPLDEDVILFEVPSGSYLRTLKGPGGRVFLVTFSRDSQLLAATTRYEAVGGAVRVWDLGGDRVRFTNPQPGPTISCAAAFSPDGKRLYTEVDGRIHGWDARSGQNVQTLELPRGGVGSLCFSPDGKRLAVANWTGCRVKIFDWTGEHLTEAPTVLDHRWPVSAVAYSPDGKFLVSGDLGGFKLWNAQTLEEIFAVETKAQQLAFAPDGRTLFTSATIDQDQVVHSFNRWDVATQKELPAISVEVNGAPVRIFHCLSRDGKTLFVARQHNATYIRIFDSEAGKELFPRQGHTAPLYAVCISPDGRTVASGGEDRMVKIWDLASGQVRHSLVAHTATICGLAFRPDGKQLASGSRDGTIALWDVDSGIEVRALHGHSRSVSRVQFSPDGKTLAAGGEKGTVKFWDVATGKERGTLAGHTGAVYCIAFSPDGSLIASGGEDKSVQVHNLAQGGLRKFQAPNVVNQVAFSADGRTLASVGDFREGSVCLWNLETGQEQARQGHAGRVHDLAFSPSAPLLATCGEDDTVRLWDLTGGDAPVHTIGPGPFGGGVRSVAFTPDGRFLATANANGAVYLLHVGYSH